MMKRKLTHRQVRRIEKAQDAKRQRAERIAGGSALVGKQGGRGRKRYKRGGAELENRGAEGWGLEGQELENREAGRGLESAGLDGQALENTKLEGREPEGRGLENQELEGLVVAHFGHQVDVEAAGQTRRCHLRANLGDLVTGDRVVWHDGEPTGVVVARQPRDSALLRPDSHGTLKPVAANIDQIVVVIAPLPQPRPELLDRYLVAAEAALIPAAILLNKADLLDADNRGAIEELLAPYPALDYPVLRASCKQRDGLDALRPLLAGSTSVFVGQSGVGKSSLVNALLQSAALRVGELSPTLGKGTHTTSTARMFRLDDGGWLIDSPGVREFGLGHIGRDQVEGGFRELRALLGHCKFRDCRHEQEPGCALLAAVEAGEVSARRLASYRHIQETVG